MSIGRKSGPNSHQRKWGFGDSWSSTGTKLGEIHATEQSEEKKAAFAEAVLKLLSGGSRSDIKKVIRSRREGWEEAKKLNDEIVKIAKDLTLR